MVWLSTQMDLESTKRCFGEGLLGADFLKRGNWLEGDPVPEC